MTSNSEHLPQGWIKTFDNSGNPFYVDTDANPPRSTWNHPFQDEEYLRTHEKPPDKKKGFLGKLKDKAIGTREEREAERARIAQLQEQRRRRHLAAFGNQSMGPHAYDPQYMPPRRRRGGNNALPLVAGMAGGLLLGDMLDDGFGDADFGDNDFGGF